MFNGCTAPFAYKIIHAAAAARVRVDVRVYVWRD